MFVYIDTENIKPQTWALSVHNLAKTDKLFIIYTTSSAKLPYECVTKLHKCEAQIEVVEATCGTPNALDFVLIALLSQKCATAKKTSHVIISRDKGYGAAISYLYDKGYRVSRCDTLAEAIRRERG